MTSCDALVCSTAADAGSTMQVTQAPSEALLAPNGIVIMLAPSVGPALV